MKFLIRAQLEGDIIEEDFDVGYVQGSSIVNIRSKIDLDKVWDGVRKGANTVLWCNGISVARLISSVGKKCPAVTGSDSEEGRRRR